MKALLLAVLLLAALPALAQSSPAVGTASAVPFKKANVILVTTADSASSAYLKLGRLLQTEGYSLDKVDKDLRFINTNYRSIANGRGQMALRFSVMETQTGSTIQCTAVMHMPALQYTILNGDTPVDFRGMKGSPALLAWEELCRIAAAYPGGRPEYLKKP